MGNLRAIDNFEQFTHCPRCSSRYSNDGIIILEEGEVQSTFHLNCSRCNMSLLAFISFSQFGAVSLGMITDLSGHEAKKFYRKEPITTDYVIEVHQCLKDSK